MTNYFGWRDVAEFLLLPPGCVIALMLAAALFWRRLPRLARRLWGLATLLLVLLSTPLLAGALLEGLEAPPLDPASVAGRPDAAIVVLSADLAAAQPDYGGDTVGKYTLERMRYAARLHRATGLPILVSGGVLKDGTRPVAEIMRDVFAEDFHVPVRWLEGQSLTTLENAVYSARLLRADGFKTAVVVTHAWHMARAAASFAAAGMDCVAAPTVFVGPIDFADYRTYVPRASALLGSYFALHEWIGRAWYLVLDRVAPARASSERSIGGVTKTSA